MFRRQPSAIYRRTAPSSRRTFGDVHQGQKWVRHIGDTSATHRRQIGDARVNIGAAYSM